VVRLGDRTVELLPKLFRSPTPDAATAAKTVLATLAEARRVKLYPLGDAAVDTGRLDWFEALSGRRRGCEAVGARVKLGTHRFAASTWQELPG
jgi:hypothetical protein